VKADRGVLLTLEDGDLVVRANKGEASVSVPRCATVCLISGTSVLVRDTSIDDAYRERRSIVEQNIRTLMAVTAARHAMRLSGSSTWIRLRCFGSSRKTI